jgi:hypothetical protein
LSQAPNCADRQAAPKDGKVVTVYLGDAWEFLRNDKMNANTFFNNVNGISRPSFRGNEFGGTIIRDKTFFFGDYQGIRLAQPETLTSTIPTLAQQQMVETGNFSGLEAQIYNPYAIQQTAGTRQRVTVCRQSDPGKSARPSRSTIIYIVTRSEPSTGGEQLYFQPSAHAAHRSV